MVFLKEQNDTKNVFFTFPVENFQNVTKKAVAFNIS